MKNLKNVLLNPDQSTKLWAMWIWNKTISEEELMNQFNSFVEKGFGGLAIRPSRDMSPTYLSEEFFRLLKLVLTSAKEKGIKIRIADDFSVSYNNFFQSIAEQNSSYRGQMLKLVHHQGVAAKESFHYDFEKGVDYVVLTAKMKDDKIHPPSIKSVPFGQSDTSVTWKAPAGDWKVMVFKKEWYKDPFSNYVPNFFNPKVAHAYIHNVLEVYKSTYSKFIPSSFEGFITEMPTYIPADNRIPWDDDLIIKYKSRYKKNLINIIPVLFFEVDDSFAKNRSHVYNFILHAMYERFSTVLETWAKKNRFYQWTLCPENDIDGPENTLKDMMTIPNAPLAAVGIQNQNGTAKNYSILRTLANSNQVEYNRESVAVIGRNTSCASTTLQELKTEVDKLITMGVSKIILDGCYFNIDQRNYIKTPFNPFWYHPEWERINTLCDYVARMNTLAKGIQRKCPVAVVSPSLSAMADYFPSNNESITKARIVFNKVLDALLSENIEFDVISESFLVGCNVFSDGEFGKTTKNALRKGHYKAIIFPFSRLISNSTFVFLEKLSTKKGTIVFIDEAPQGNFDDGQNASFGARVARLTRPKNKNIHVCSIHEFLNKTATDYPAIDISTEGKPCKDIHTTFGTKDTYTTCIIRNNSTKNDHFVTVTIPKVNHVYLVDCDNPHCYEIDLDDAEDGLNSFKHNFLPQQTTVFIFSSTKIPGLDSKKGKQPSLEIYQELSKKYRVVLKDRWKFTPTSFNSLPLATWNKRIGLSRDSGGFSHYYESHFEIEDIPSTCFLTLCGFNNDAEKNRHLEVSVNSITIKPFEIKENTEEEQSNESDFAIDEFYGKSSPKYNIKDMIMKGINRVTVRTVGSIEDPAPVKYPPVISGDFAIKKGSKGWIIKEFNADINYGSWTKYGYPYLSGKGVYEQLFEMPSEFDKIILRFEKISGTVSVEVNDKSFGQLDWQPLAVDITEVVEPRRNVLRIEVQNTIDNLIKMNGRPSGLIGEVYLDIY